MIDRHFFVFDRASRLLSDYGARARDWPTRKRRLHRRPRRRSHFFGVPPRTTLQNSGFLGRVPRAAFRVRHNRTHEPLVVPPSSDQDVRHPGLCEPPRHRRGAARRRALQRVVPRRHHVPHGGPQRRAHARRRDGRRRGQVRRQAPDGGQGGPQRGRPRPRAPRVPQEGSPRGTCPRRPAHDHPPRPHVISQKAANTWRHLPIHTCGARVSVLPRYRV